MESRRAVTFTREELYRLVWETPMRKLAQTYNISDVGLAKICKAHGIPRPPVGYWQKKEVGKQPPTPPLPPCDDPKLQEVGLVWVPEEERRKATNPPPPVVYDEDVAALLAQAKALPPIEVTPSLRGLHRMVQATRRGLDGKRADYHSLVSASWTEEPNAMDAAVGEKSVRRALCLLNAVVRAIESQGGSVFNDREKMPIETTITMAGERVGILRLREKVERKPATLETCRHTTAESRREPVPTGIFSLTVGGACRQDTPRRRVEDEINSLLVGLIQTAGDIRIRRRQEEEMRQRRAEEDRIRAEEDRLRREHEQELQRRRVELQQQQKAKQARVNSLFSQADAWHRSKIVRDYIEAVKEFFMKKHGCIDEGSEADSWLKWASQQADRSDPLVPSPPSILDEKI